MDIQFGLRESLFLVGLLIIALIIVDGLRRMRKSRQNLKRPPVTEPSLLEEALPMYPNELPTGGARRVQLDTVVESSVSVAYHDPSEKSEQERDVIMESNTVAYSSNVRTIYPAEVSTLGQEVCVELEDNQEDELDVSSAEEVIVITVMAKKDSVFPGDLLLRVAKQVGLKYGEMGIFHRYEQSGLGKKGQLFSMANVLEPGTFDLETMSETSTRGVCLFLTLPGPKKSVLAFELLVDTARKIARLLGGELQDGRRRILTSQILEQYRQRALNFDRRSQPARFSLTGE